jgi:hypothetical protein
MSPQEVAAQVRRRAGIRNDRVPVFYIDHQRSIPPSLRRTKKGRKRDRRIVVVSAAWLRTKQPAWWSALMGARLLQNPDDENKITFTSLREADRYDPDRQGA